MSEALAPGPGKHAFDEPATLVERKIPGWMAFGVNVLVFIIEASFLLWALSHKVELEYFLLLHGIILGLLIWWHRWCKRTYQAYLFPTVTLVFVASLGPLGALGTAYAKLVHAFFLRDRHPFGTILGALFADGDSAASQRLYEGLVRLDPGIEVEQALAPLVSVMSHGGLAQKQAAIMLMSRHFIPPFSPILKDALHDRDPSIEAMAISAIRQIEEDAAQEGRELEQDLNYQQDEDTILALALHFDQWAWADIVDETQKRIARDRAMGFYHKYLQLQPKDISVIKEVGRLLYRGGQLHEAGQWFDQHRLLAAGSPAFLAWDMEVLFALGRFDELRKVAGKHQKALCNATIYPLHIQDTLQLWGNAGAGSP